MTTSNNLLPWPEEFILSTVPGLSTYGNREFPGQDSKVFKIGKFEVRDGPLYELPGKVSIWRLYSVFFDKKFVGSQMSMPNAEQCQDLMSRWTPSHFRNRILPRI